MAKAPIRVVLEFDPEDMARRGRIGAYTTHSRHDTRVTTAAARAAFRQRFVDQVDPTRELPEAERARRAEAARRAWYAKIARKSAATRARRVSRAAAPPAAAA